MWLWACTWLDWALNQLGGPPQWGGPGPCGAVVSCQPSKRHPNKQKQAQAAGPMGRSAQPAKPAAGPGQTKEAQVDRPVAPRLLTWAVHPRTAGGYDGHSTTQHKGPAQGRWTQSLAEMVPAQARRSSSTATTEAAHSGHHIGSCDVRHVSASRRAQRQQSGTGRLSSRVFGPQLVHYPRRVLDERRGHQSGASSGKFTFSSQLTASRMSGGALVVTGAGYMFGTGVHVGKKQRVSMDL